jgi:4-alpha-glucanotransferase
MKILQFAFGNDPMAEKYLPYSYPPHCIVYTGTHDNDTTVGWFTNTEVASTQSAEEIAEERGFVLRYLGTDGREIHWDLARLALSSVADTAILPLQDILGLGSEARMNTPGIGVGNWGWRFREDQLDATCRTRLRELTAIYGRWNGTAPSGLRPPRPQRVEEPYVGR